MSRLDTLSQSIRDLYTARHADRDYHNKLLFADEKTALKSDYAMLKEIYSR